MSLNKENDDEDPNKLVIPQEIQDEIAHVIQTSLNNVATQINNLSKCAEGILGKLSNEVDEVSCRFNTLQGHVIQLTDFITYKDINNDSSLQDTKSKAASQSTTTQTQQVRSSNSLSVKMYETRDACVQTLPLNMAIPYCQDGADGFMISAILNCFETYNKMFVPESKEQKQKKLKQKNKHLDHSNNPESVPQSQLLGNDISVDDISAACGELYHSYTDPAAESSSFPTCQFSEISKVLTRAVGKVLSSPPRLQKKGSGDLKNSFTYVSYGTGMGEEVQPQPPIRLKTEMYVSPTAPTPPPPLPPDWSSLLRPSKMETPSPIIHSQIQVPSPVLTTPGGTSLPDCLQTIPEAGLPTTPPKKDFSPPVHNPLQYNEIMPHDRLTQEEEGELSPPMSSYPVTSHKIETKDTLTDLVGCASIVQSPPSLVSPPARSSFTQSPSPSVSKPPRPSVLSTPRPPLLPQPRQMIPPLSKSAPQLPRHSTPKTSQRSIPLSLFSCSKEARFSVSSPSPSLAPSPKTSATPSSRHLDAQSSRSSDASSGKSSTAQSTGQLIPPQQRSSSLKSTGSFTLQPLLSFPQSPSSCISSPQALSMFQSSPAPVSPAIKQSPSIPPTFNKARSALMEAIRKGVLLRKTEDRCLLKAKIEISQNEETSIMIHRKSTGYNSGISDNKAD